MSLKKDTPRLSHSCQKRFSFPSSKEAHFGFELFTSPRFPLSTKGWKQAKVRKVLSGASLMHETTNEFPMVRHVPYMGVIWTVAEASKLGFYIIPP
jgi:hypothetical protein